MLPSRGIRFFEKKEAFHQKSSKYLLELTGSVYHFTTSCAVRMVTGRIMRKPAALLILLALGISIWTSCVEKAPRTRHLQILEAISIGDVDVLRTMVKNTPSAVKTRDQDKKTFLHLCGAHPVMSRVYVNRTIKESRGILSKIIKTGRQTARLWQNC